MLDIESKLNITNDENEIYYNKIQILKTNLNKLNDSHKIIQND